MSRRFTVRGTLTIGGDWFRMDFALTVDADDEREAQGKVRYALTNHEHSMATIEIESVDELTQEAA